MNETLENIKKHWIDFKYTYPKTADKLAFSTGTLGLGSAILLPLLPITVSILPFVSLTAFVALPFGVICSTTYLAEKWEAPSNPSETEEWVNERKQTVKSSNLRKHQLANAQKSLSSHFSAKSRGKNDKLTRLIIGNCDKQIKKILKETAEMRQDVTILSAGDEGASASEYEFAKPVTEEIAVMVPATKKRTTYQPISI